MNNNSAKKRIHLSATSSILIHVLVLLLGITGSIAIKQRFKSVEAIVVNTNSNQIPPISAKFQSQNNALGGGKTDEPNKIIRSFTQYSHITHTGIKKKEKKTALPSRQTHNWTTNVQSLDVVFITQSPPLSAKNQTIGTQKSHQEILLKQLRAQLHRLIQEQNTGKKRLFIGITARKTAHAQYTNAIAEKIEKIGTQNFPDEAKKKPFKLIVTISIRQNGALEHIQVERSSGSSNLDKVACHLIRKAFPAKPFPSSIRKEYFAIDMTRTIYFDPEQNEKDDKNPTNS